MATVKKGCTSKVLIDAMNQAYDNFDFDKYIEETTIPKEAFDRLDSSLKKNDKKGG